MRSAPLHHVGGRRKRSAECVELVVGHRSGQHPFLASASTRDAVACGVSRAAISLYGFSRAEKLQPLISFRWSNLKNLGADNPFGDKRIVVHPALKIGQRCVVRHNPTTQIRLNAADQQEYTVIEAALDPFLMAFNEPTGLVFVAGKPKQHDEHLVLSSSRW